MKGVIAGLAPDARVVDLCHEVPAQDVSTAALHLRAAVPYFPEGTVFVCVVDPGVGTKRRILLAKTKRHYFLAPDNGLLSWIPERVLEWKSVKYKDPPSTTFHGRDVFAPLAAKCPDIEGKAISDPILRPWPKDRIVGFDRFGNALTSLKSAKTVAFGRYRIPVVRTYSDVAEGEPLAIVGSSGLIELSVRNGDFARRFSAKTGDKVHA